MRNHTLPARAVLVAVLLGLACLTGCTGSVEPVAAPTTSVSASSSPSPTPTFTPTATPTPTPTPTVTGNGIAEMEPIEILEQTRKATLGADSVRMRGQMRDENGKWVKADLRIQDGVKATGYIEVDGGRVDLIMIGSSIYFKADREFLTRHSEGQDVSETLGKYIKTTVDDKNWSEVTALTSVSRMLADLPELDGFDYATRGVPTYINDLPAIPVGKPGYTNLYVSTEGKPYLVRLSYIEEEEYIDFLDYNKPVIAKRPPAHLVIDIGKVDRPVITASGVGAPR